MIAKVPEEQRGINGFLSATAVPESHLQDMQRAASEMAAAGTMVQLGEAAADMSADLVIGLIGFMKRQDNVVAYKIVGFESDNAMFKATSIVDHEAHIHFSRHELAVFPCAQYLTLAWYSSDTSQLPSPERKPRGLFIRNVNPLVISVCDTSRELAQIACARGSMAASSSSMSPPHLLPQVQDGHSAIRQHDPSKQRVSGLSPNVSLVFSGELHKFVNAVYSSVYDAVVGRGEFGGTCPSEQIFILLSSDVCIQLMSAHWVDLYWFGTQSKDIHVMSKKGAGIIVNREDWSSWSVDEVEAAWFNARILFDRLFGAKPLLKEVWIGVYSEMQRLKLSQPMYFFLLRYGWVQYEIMNELASRFFAVITKPDVTMEEMEKAVRDFAVHEDSIIFNKMYSAIEKRHLFHTANSGKHARDTGTDTVVPTLSKKQRKAAKAQADAAAAAKTTKVVNGGGQGGGVGGGRHKSAMLCFPYLSTAGCPHSDANCRFRHEPAAGKSAPELVKIKAEMALRSLVADPAKF